jgi:hypothetical protein
MKNYWSLRLSNVLAIIFTIAPMLGIAQFSPPEIKFATSEEKYLYPIKPGQPGSLAGTMGELRSTHFHSGIDIRTNNIIGLPVLASKSGYISRASVSASGYGNVLYITHPDGYTTLYAHLDKFKGKVAQYILEEQYRKKTGEIDLFFKEGEFVVKRGDTIALSGNSGSSGGPHLHFDIRDPNNYALNPLQVEGFPEIVDNLPPSVEKIALKTLDIDSRINDRFGRFEFYAQRTGKDYALTVPIMASGSIGLEILAKDRLAPKSPFWGGVNYIEVRVDSQLIFNQSIDKINIAETRAIYTLMDFKALRMNGTRFYKLYVDDGNILDFYSKSPSRGIIKVDPATEHDVRITMRDSYGNTSNISLKLLATPPAKDVKLLEPMKIPVAYEIQDNTLIVSAQPCLTDSNQAIVYTRSQQRKATPAYANAFRTVYLFDLRKEIPDSVTLCGNTIAPGIKIMIPPGRDYNYYSDIMDIEFPSNSLYDTIYLSTGYSVGPDSLEQFKIGSRIYPMDKAINVTIRPAREYKWDKSYAVYRTAGKGFTHLGGGWMNGGVHFSTREFGEFVILRDTISPTIKVVAINNSVARFKIRDNLSGIDKFEANINGKWLLMQYDAKTASIWSEKLNKTELLKGTFTLVVTDNAGNEARYTHKIP